MRIIAGKYKNKLIPTLKKSTYRPTKQMVREALFNVLRSIEMIGDWSLENAKILEIFSGSGSVSFEAFSRGAVSAVLIDNDANNLKCSEKFINSIDQRSSFKLFNLDISSQIKLDFNEKFDLIFIDPPYKQSLAEKTLDLILNSAEWLLSPKCIIIVESAKNEDFKPREEFDIIKEKIYGNSKLTFLNLNHD